MIAGTVPRPRCVYCGNRYGQRDLTTQSVFTAPGSEPEFPDSHMIEVRRRSWQQGTSVRHERELWDGASWNGGQAPFCTYRCTHDFACDALAGGFPPPYSP